MELGWIDFSRSERNKVLNVIDLLSEDGTLDELGIGPVRDGFANLFFPGTSTIQTRAKYFFVVPYALKDIERSGELNPNRALIALDAIERMCAETFLAEAQDTAGVIGKRSLQGGRWVKRPPSDIYWAGLRRYGIFTGGTMSITEYIRAFCAVKSQKTTTLKLGNRNDGAEENECDDKNASDISLAQFWNMPLYTPGWLDTVSIRLTGVESRFLRNQIRKTCHGSMLEYILDNHLTMFLNFDSFKGLSAMIDQFPAQIQSDYRLACAFSDFVFALRVVYNIILSDGKNEEANELFEHLKPAFPRMANLDIAVILARLSVVNLPLKSFLSQARLLMLGNDMDALKKCIRAREIQLKGAGRARSNQPGQFDPNQWFGSGELDYRFGNVKVLLGDIFDGEAVRDDPSKQ